jgi:hypothetical protein
MSDALSLVSLDTLRHAVSARKRLISPGCNAQVPAQGARAASTTGEFGVVKQRKASASASACNFEFDTTCVAPIRGVPEVGFAECLSRYRIMRLLDTRARGSGE